MTAWSYDMRAAPAHGTTAWVAVRSEGDPERLSTELAYWAIEDDGGSVSARWCYHGTGDAVKGEVYAWTRVDVPAPPARRGGDES